MKDFLGTHWELLIFETELITALVNEICDKLENGKDLSNDERSNWVARLNCFRDILEINLEAKKQISELYQQQTAAL